MKSHLHLLLIEDSENDQTLILYNIIQAGYNVSAKRIESSQELETALKEETWDFIISDYQLPEFNGLEALHILKNTGLDIPFVFVSGVADEKIALQAMKEGAQDYLFKDNLNRLPIIIERELRDAEMRRTQLENEQALIESERQFRSLVENSLYGFFIFQDGKIVFANKKYIEMVGYTSLEEVLALTPEQIIETVHPNYRETIVNNMARRLQGESVPGQYEFAVYDKQQKLHWAEISAVLSEFHGKPAIEVIVVDITERKTKDEKLREQANLLDQA
ncbi:MAG: PAS domain S-box protein, partial [Bacteroidota bacterium]|nr:PAS domain S-box protein [Bacteroidota bacterium]